MKVLPFDTDAHHAVQTLLPWHAMGSLDADDAARVESHLAGCPICRAELDLERWLQAAQPRPVDRGEVEQGLARMRELIRLAPQRARTTPARWLHWALGAQFAVVAVLAAVLVLELTGTEPYRALGAPDAGASANAVVIFKPEATEQEMRRALRDSGARLVDGPTASNAYLLNVPNDGHVAAIARLRAQPAVAIAESLETRPAP